MKGATDEVLISRVAESGDRQAISELYDRYSGLVYSAGVRYLDDRTLAEDLVQDVFLLVWRNAASFDPSRAGFSTWIYRITRNRSIDMMRRQERAPWTVGTVYEAFLEHDGSDTTEEVLRSFDVLGTLSELSPAHREVLMLAYFGGLSQREISRRTGTPLGTIKSRATAALRAARERMLARRASHGSRKRVPRSRRSEDG